MRDFTHAFARWNGGRQPVKAWLLASALIFAAGPAFAGAAVWNNNGDAGNNNSPPAGAILDLGGGETSTPAQSVNHGTPVGESVSFTAGVANTAITFAFREDPAFISFSNASLRFFPSVTR